MTVCSGSVPCYCFLTLSATPHMNKILETKSTLVRLWTERWRTGSRCSVTSYRRMLSRVHQMSNTTVKAREGLDECYRTMRSKRQIVEDSQSSKNQWLASFLRLFLLLVFRPLVDWRTQNIYIELLLPSHNAQGQSLALPVNVTTLSHASVAIAYTTANHALLPSPQNVDCRFTWWLTQFHKLALSIPLRSHLVLEPHSWRNKEKTIQGFEFKVWGFKFLHQLVCNTFNSPSFFWLSFRSILFLMFHFHFFLSQISESAFIKTPFSRYFFIVSHDNSIAIIYMTQVSSAHPLRWMAFLRNYPASDKYFSFVVQSLFPQNECRLPSIQETVTGWECTRLGLASTYCRRKVPERRFGQHLGKFSLYFLSSVNMNPLFSSRISVLFSISFS